MRLIHVFAVGCVLAVSGRAEAAITLNNGEVVNLATLLAVGSDRQFIVGDKLFTIESFTSSSFIPSEFSVVGFVAANPLSGRGFDLTGPFGDGTPGDGGVHEMNIQYTVEVLPAFYAQGYRIVDTGLVFNGSSFGDGSYSRVDESVLDFDLNQLIGQPSVYDIFGPPQSIQLQSLLNFNGVRKLEINKDLKFFAAHAGDAATASFVRQSFSQIPSPGAAVLLVLGGLGLMRGRRR
jgi:hypothetical protein